DTSYTRTEKKDEAHQQERCGVPYGHIRDEQYPGGRQRDEEQCDGRGAPIEELADEEVRSDHSEHSDHEGLSKEARARHAEDRERTRRHIALGGTLTSRGEEGREVPAKHAECAHSGQER